MAKTKIDVPFFLITLFFGWFGVDKFCKGDVKVGLVKLLLNFLLIGEIWNIYDCVCICMGNYKINPLK